MYGLNRYYGSGCYRLLDDNKKIIYIGYAKNISDSLSKQFRTNSGHLPRECYSKTAKIEICKTVDYPTSRSLKPFLINKYKPKYNKQDKSNNINSKVVSNEEYYESIEHWELYHEFRPFLEDKKFKITKTNIIIASVYIGLIVLITIIK